LCRKAVLSAARAFGFQGYKCQQLKSKQGDYTGLVALERGGILNVEAASEIFMIKEEADIPEV